VTAAGLQACIAAEDDAGFDRIFPPVVRLVSARHWTPVEVARRAAEFLVRGPGTRVLDIGCGPGKFCIVGALTTPGRFTGIELRPHLCVLARKKLKQAGLADARILEGNVLDLDFSAFDAFYLFNPFAENIGEAPAIDGTVPLSAARHADYIGHVAAQLAAAPSGTRLATYFGAGWEVPAGYACVGTAFGRALKFWEKKSM
jgi:SAM-dependent methyltransferase